MAHEITTPLFGHFVTAPDMKQVLSDVTASTRQVLTLHHGAQWFQAMIYVKAFTAGTGTIESTFKLEAASDAGFTTDVVSLGVGVASRADEQTVFMMGFSPLKALRYVGVTRVANGTDAATFDAVVVGS
jgi:hypothetical protein